MPQILSTERDSLKEHLTQAKRKEKTPNQTKNKTKTKKKTGKNLLSRKHTCGREVHYGGVIQERKAGAEEFRTRAVGDEWRSQELKGTKAVFPKTLFLSSWWYCGGRSGTRCFN